MDRRQQKTRRAIFSAFRTLLEGKRYDHITVQEIIDAADVGRSTFYAHFETKEMLLEAMCGDIFHHLFERDDCPWEGKDAEAEARLAHVLWHVRDCRKDLSAILRSESGEVFMTYFARHTEALFTHHAAAFAHDLPEGALPADYLQHQLVMGFAATVRWWVARDCADAPEDVARCFMAVYGRKSPQ